MYKQWNKKLKKKWNHEVSATWLELNYSVLHNKSEGKIQNQGTDGIKKLSDHRLQNLPINNVRRDYGGKQIGSKVT